MTQKTSQTRQNTISMKGFTLVELMVGISIIALLATIIVISLDPLTRFEDARNTKRRNDVYAILNATKLDQADHGGTYFGTLDFVNEDQNYQIGLAQTGCSIACGQTGLALDDECLDIFELEFRGYLASLPIDPNGGSANFDNTHYYIRKNSNGTVTVGSCDVELGSNEQIPDISITR